MPKPIFDAEQHKYTTPEGKRLDGVTTILGEYRTVRIGREKYSFGLTDQAIPTSTLSKAADFGTAAHTCVEYALTLGVDGFDYPEEMQGIIDQVAFWQNIVKPEIVAVELALYCPQDLFAGTMDIVCRIDGVLSIIDVKTGEGILTGPQTAGYERLYRADTGCTEEIKRYKLRLFKEKGKKAPKMQPMTNRQDWSMFKASLIRYRYLQQLLA